MKLVYDSYNLVTWQVEHLYNCSLLGCVIFEIWGQRWSDYFTYITVKIIRAGWIPNMETHSANMIKTRTETRQRVNEVSLKQNCLFICLFMSKNHVRACLRITTAVLNQWQKWRLQMFGSIFSILLCLLSGKLTLGSKT